VIDYSIFGLERGLLWTGVVFGHHAVKLPRFLTRNVISLPHQAQWEKMSVTVFSHGKC